MMLLRMTEAQRAALDEAATVGGFRNAQELVMARLAHDLAGAASA